MKKFLAILMAALLLFSVTACSSSNEPAQPAESGSEAEEQLTLAAGKLSVAISLLSKGLSRVFSNTTLQKHQFFGTQFGDKHTPVRASLESQLVKTLPAVQET